METATLLIGLGLLALLVVDVVKTTLGEGGGPLTKRASAGLWRVALHVTNRPRGRSHRLLAWAGLGVVHFIIGTWVLLLWAGWSLVFVGANPPVVLLQNGQPAGFLETIYFAGSSVFTLGFGDYAFQVESWQLLSTVAGFSGLFIVTLAITYLTPVVQAATQRRQLAAYLTTLGRSPSEMLEHTWNGSDWSSLEPHLVSVTSQITYLDQRHLAYPVLHFFHSPSRISSTASSIAALDEALTILEYGVQDSARIDQGIYHPVRTAISTLLATLQEAYIPPADHVPPLSSLHTLREAGLPVLDDTEFEMRASGIADRRRLLLGFVENDGWSWDSVSAS